LKKFWALVFRFRKDINYATNKNPYPNSTIPYTLKSNKYRLILQLMTLQML
jgi:hypothetical protein